MKIPNMRKQREHAHPYASDVLNPRDKFHEPKMKGKTGVFIKRKDAIEYANRTPELVVIKMKLGGEIYNSLINIHYTKKTKTLVGTEILEMTELKSVGKYTTK